MEIVVGTRKWSTWSLRPWLALKRTGAPFTETLVQLREVETSTAEILRHSPSGLVPVLKADGLVIWDSLAICEYLAERFPQLMPEGPFPVRVIAVERTFWEKACLLHEETFRPHDLLKWNCRHFAIAEIILQVSPAMPRERLFWPHVPRR
jgi:glutathione S-transferase